MNSPEREGVGGGVGDGGGEGFFKGGEPSGRVVFWFLSMLVEC